MKNSVRSKVLKSDDCFTTTALSIFLDDFGVDALDWLPETINREMEGKYGALPDTTFNKLMVGIQLLTADDFYRVLKRFIGYVNIINHGHLDDFVADVGEISWALVEAKIIDDPSPVKNPFDLFSSDVLGYIEVAFNDSGLVFPPKVFKEFGLLFTQKAQNALYTFSDNVDLFGLLYKTSQYHTTLVDASLEKTLNELRGQLVQCGFPELVFEKPRAA